MKNLTLIIVCALFCISTSVVSKNVFTPAKPVKFFVKDYTFKREAIEASKSLHVDGWQNIHLVVSETYETARPAIIVTAEKY